MSISYFDCDFAPLMSSLRSEIVNAWRKRLFTLGNKTSLERLLAIDKHLAEGYERYLYEGTIDTGLFGDVAEIAHSAKFSLKTWVASPGEPDIHIKWRATPSSEITYESCEFKTGNGDISALYEPRASRFVAYCYILENSNGRRWVEPQLLLRTQFLEMLERNDLVQVSKPDKLHPTTRVRVKGQSAKLYRWLEGYGLPLDPDAVYTPDDFEDIDLNA